MASLKISNIVGNEDILLKRLRGIESPGKRKLVQNIKEMNYAEVFRELIYRVELYTKAKVLNYTGRDLNIILNSVNALGFDTVVDALLEKELVSDSNQSQSQSQSQSQNQYIFTKLTNVGIIEDNIIKEYQGQMTKNTEVTLKKIKNIKNKKYAIFTEKNYDYNLWVLEYETFLFNTELVSTTGFDTVVDAVLDKQLTQDGNRLSIDELLQQFFGNFPLEKFMQSYKNHIVNYAMDNKKSARSAFLDLLADYFVNLYSEINGYGDVDTTKMSEIYPEVSEMYIGINAIPYDYLVAVFGNSIILDNNLQDTIFNYAKIS